MAANTVEQRADALTRYRILGCDNSAHEAKAAVATTVLDTTLPRIDKISYVLERTERVAVASHFQAAKKI